jgi:hypothetical protein
MRLNQLAAPCTKQRTQQHAVASVGTWLGLSTPPKMLITLAGVATMKPYLPLPAASVRNCTHNWQHDQHMHAVHLAVRCTHCKHW